MIVIGGGPAGSATALRLARAGLHVILLERRDFATPSGDGMRSGEGLIARTMRELAALHVELNPASWQLAPVERVRFHWPNDATQELALQPNALVHVDRERLDAALFEAARTAGADTREGWRVRHFERAGHAVRGVVAQPPGSTNLHAIHAPLVIDAGGRNALALRSFDLRTPVPHMDFFAMALFFDDVADVQDNLWEMHLLDPSQLTVVQLSRMRPGLVRCGLGVSRAVQQSAGCDPMTFFWRRMACSPELYRRLRAGRMVSKPYTRAKLGYSVRAAALDGLLLVGDAAGYLNPLFGDGVLRALRDARAASSTAIRAFASGRMDQVALAPYARYHATKRTVDAFLARALAFGYAAPGMLTALGQWRATPAALLAALTR